MLRLVHGGKEDEPTRQACTTRLKFTLVGGLCIEIPCEHVKHAMELQKAVVENVLPYGTIDVNGRPFSLRMDKILTLEILA
jgi:hypothetical protein